MIKIRNKGIDKIKQWHLQGFKASNGFVELNKLAKQQKLKRKRFWNLILEKIENIILGTPEELENLLEEMQINFPTLAQCDTVTSVFNYNGFVKNKGNGWNAYKLAEQLNIRTCPYCNIRFTHTVTTYKEGNNKERITRPDFDHFLNKSKNPIFGLSFFNLIPSCTTCNSKSKGVKPFSIKTHLHPYLRGFDDLIKFRLKVHDTSFFHGHLSGGIIEFVEKVTSDTTELELLIKARKNIADFRLFELYQEHLDYIYELVSKAMVYNEDYLDELANQFSFLSRTDFLRVVTSNYIDIDELHLRPLSKLTKDLCEQFELD